MLRMNKFEQNVVPRNFFTFMDYLIYLSIMYICQPYKPPPLSVLVRVGAHDPHVLILHLVSTCIQGLWDAIINTHSSFKGHQGQAFINTYFIHGNWHMRWATILPNFLVIHLIAYPSPTPVKVLLPAIHMIGLVLTQTTSSQLIFYLA